MAQTNNKKALRNKVEIILAESFPDIKTSVGNKKFSKKVKKAGKILAAGATNQAKKPEVKKVKAKNKEKKKVASK